MEDPASQPLGRFVQRRIERRGLRPRVAASIIAVTWLAAVVIFGLIGFLVDREAFETVWDGMWWATQTVTTVGYGDVVPDQGAGRIVGAVLMIGGLSFFAVITGVITSVFVARAQSGARESHEHEVEERLERIGDELAAIRRSVAGLQHGDGGQQGPFSSR